MQTSRRSTLAAAAIVLALALPALAGPLEIGSPAPAFSLPGVDGKTYTLDDFRQADVLVVVFTCNHCPTSQAYEDRIKQLAADYKDKKVALVAVCPNDPLAVRPDELGYSDLNDSLADMKIRAKDKGFTFPYLFDGEDQKFSRACGAIATPHVFVFDRERHLRYAGRVDDAENPKKVTVSDARNAIDALLAGKSVPAVRTRVFGCSVKWSDKRPSAQKAAQAAERESVTLATLDDAGIPGLGKNDSERVRLVYVWSPGDKGGADRLGDFAAMNQMYRRRKFELVTLCLAGADQKEQVLGALLKNHVSAANFVLDAKDKDKLKTLDEKFDGTLPYTVLIAPGGKVLWSKAGPCDALEVRRAIVGQLGRTYE